MRINTVRLTNYRVHRGETTYTFSHGINLLLGANGAGKSSVLEAIGLALFNSGLRGSQKCAVTHGEKSALIQVEITGNDENEYLIERRIGSSPRWRISRLGEKGFFAEGEKEVSEKLALLAEVDNDIKTVYDSVLCARQNRFVDIFQASNAAREGVFNQLFDVKVYRDIFDQLRGDTGPIRKYEEDVTLLKGRLLEKDALILDSEVLQKEFDALQKEGEELEKGLQKLRKESEEAVAEVSMLEGQAQEVNGLKQKIHTKEELVTSLQEQLEGLKKREKLSRQAFESVSSNIHAYEKYQGLSEEVKNARARSVATAKRFSEIQEKEVLFRKQEGELAVLKTRLEAENRELAALSEKQKELEAFLLEIVNERDDITLKGQMLKAEIELSKEKLNGMQGVYDRINSIEIRGRELSQLEKELKNSLTGLESLELWRDTLAISEKCLKERRVDFEEKQRGIQGLRAKIEELNQSALQLSSGVCPILSETCRNITESKDSGAYFQDREALLLKLVNEKIDQQEDEGLLKKEEEEYRTQRAKYEEASRSDLEKSERIISMQREIVELRHAWKSETAFLTEKYAYNFTSIEEFTQYLLEQSNSISQKEVEKRVLTDRYKEKHSRCMVLQDELRTVQEKLQQLTESIQSLQSALYAGQKIKDEAERTLQNKESVKDELAHIEQELSLIEKQQKEVEAGYKLVVENKKSADELDDIVAECKSISEKVVLLTEEVLAIKTSLDEKKKGFSLDELEQKRGVLENLKNKEQKERLASSLKQQELQLQQQKVLDNDSLHKECTKMREALRHLNEKLRLAVLFRDNVKGLGKHVTAQKVRQIGLKATENYQLITGKGDEVIWSNSEGDLYSLYLNDRVVDSQREFTQLSGGEQVVVALSVRAALSQYFSKAGFAIFDEPTVNLDSESRTALADSLAKMLGKMEQVFVVTHDGTFREMAQKTIYFE